VACCVIPHVLVIYSRIALCLLVVLISHSAIKFHPVVCMLTQIPRNVSLLLGYFAAIVGNLMGLFLLFLINLPYCVCHVSVEIVISDVASIGPGSAFRTMLCLLVVLENTHQSYYLKCT